jgi:hypothetical protein
MPFLQLLPQLIGNEPMRRVRANFIGIRSANLRIHQRCEGIRMALTVAALSA